VLRRKRGKATQDEEKDNPIKGKASSTAAVWKMERTIKPENRANRASFMIPV